MKRIKRFFAPPVFADDEEQTRKAYLLNSITLSVLLGALLYGLVVPADHKRYAALEIGIALIVWLLVHRPLKSHSASGLTAHASI